MTVFQAIFLGLVQGATEFLPVSSSGHVLLAQKLIGVAADGVAVSLALHAGTLAAVVVVFFDEFFALFKPPFKKLGLLALATLPAAAFGLLAGDFFDEVFGGRYLCLAFLLTAALLFAAHFVGKKHEGRKIGVKQAAVMGVMQALALVPGVSRSGSVVAGGVFCGCDRQDVATFAFLMSMPVVFGACLLRAAEGGLVFSLPMLAGFFSSLLFGTIFAETALKFIKANNFLPFCIYLIVIAVAAFFVV